MAGTGFCTSQAPGPYPSKDITGALLYAVCQPALTPAALQVGSKNAAFFMGKCIKIATRSAGSSFVHELGIAAADLEERYKAHEASHAHDQPKNNHHTMRDQPGKRRVRPNKLMQTLCVALKIL